MGIPLWAPTTSDSSSSKAKSGRSRPTVYPSRNALRRSRHALHPDYLAYHGSSSDSDSSDEDEDKPTSRSSSPSPDTTPRARASNTSNNTGSSGNGGSELLSLTEFLRDYMSTARITDENTNPSSSSTVTADSNPPRARWALSSTGSRAWPSIPTMPPLGDRSYGPPAPAASTTARAPSPPPAAPNTEEFTNRLAYLRRLASLQDAMLRTVDATTRSLQETSSLSSSLSGPTPSSSSLEAARASLDRTTTAMNAISNLNLHEREARLRATVDVLAHELSHLSRRAAASDPVRSRLERDVERLRERLMLQRQQSLRITGALVVTDRPAAAAVVAADSETSPTTTTTTTTTTSSPAAAAAPSTTATTAAWDTADRDRETLSRVWDDLDAASARIDENLRTRTAAREERVTQRQRDREEREALRERARQLTESVRARRHALEGIIHRRDQALSTSTTAEGSTGSGDGAVRLDALGNPDDDDPTQSRGDIGPGVPVVMATMTPAEFGSAAPGVTGARRWRMQQDQVEEEQLRVFRAMAGRPA